MTPWSQENGSWSVAALRSKARGEIFDLFVLNTAFEQVGGDQIIQNQCCLLVKFVFKEQQVATVNAFLVICLRDDHADFSVWLLIACIAPEMICCYPTSNSHWHSTCTFWCLKHVLIPHMILTCRFWQSCPSVQTYCSWNLFELQCGTFTHGYNYQRLVCRKYFGNIQQCWSLVTFNLTLIFIIFQ